MIDHKSSISSWNREAVIEEREHKIQEVQQKIGEVNEIFKDLAVLVNDQETMIANDNSSHVENARSTTVQGKSHLMKASKTTIKLISGDLIRFPAPERGCGTRCTL